MAQCFPKKCWAVPCQYMDIYFVLKEGTFDNALEIAKDLAAVPAAPSKSSYRQLNQQIKVIVQDYPTRNIINSLSQSFIVYYSVNFFLSLSEQKHYYLRTLLYTIFFNFFYHRVYLLCGNWVIRDISDDFRYSLKFILFFSYLRTYEGTVIYQYEISAMTFA